MRYIIIALLFAAFCSCKKDNIDIYDTGQRYLFIPDSAGIDTVMVSFAHHPGKTEISVPFEVRMIGIYSDQELEYSVGIVDSLTTATVSDYVLPEKLRFSPWQQRDTIWVTLKNSEKLKTETLQLFLRLEENGNFKLGFPEQLTAKIVFCDKMSKPFWWDADITLNFLGVYSDKKFTEFYKCTGIDNLSDMAAWEKRKLTLEFKEYIEKNGVTEEDGQPMTVVAY